MHQASDEVEIDIEPLTEEACDDGGAPESLEELDLALARFKEAASELMVAWEGAIDEGLDPFLGIAGYPDFMPSFDEFVLEIAGMRVDDDASDPDT